MIQTLKENTWLKLTAALLLLMLAFAFWSLLAGGIFLAINGKNVDNTTPLTMYQYWFFYKNYPSVMRWWYVSALVSFFLMVVPGFKIFAPAKRTLFGNARFASKSDVAKAKLFAEIGIILGKFKGKYLIFGGQQHVMVSAATRGGKGVSIVNPNLLNWPYSAVVVDIKQESHDLTSGFRARCDQDCFLFNPLATDYRTHRYNPLGYISEDENFRIDDIQKIAYMIFPDKPGTDVIWTATPRSLFLGVVLSLLESPGKLVTMGQVLRESLVDGDGSKYFDGLIEAREKSGRPFSSTCVSALRTYTSIAADNTRSGVMGSFRSRLELWSNPVLDAATSGNDFDLRELRKKKMSIYVGVTPDNQERLKPLLNLFFQQLVDLNTRELPEKNPALKYPVLLLLDEFRALGKVDVIVQGISYIAGYGLRLLTIVQSPSQIVEVYGKDAAKTFLQNHAAQVVFAPKRSDTESAKEISEWLGYQTVKGVSESKAKTLFGKKAPSQSISDQRRALLLPQEVTSIGQEDEIVIVENVDPIRAKKAFYYSSADFIDRLKLVSKSLAKLGKKIPTRGQLESATLAGELRVQVPLIDLERHALAVKDSDSQWSSEAANRTSNSGGKTTVTKKVARVIDADDLDSLANLSLDDFMIDFSGIKKPAAGELDIAGLTQYADALCKQAGINI